MSLIMHIQTHAKPWDVHTRRLQLLMLGMMMEDVVEVGKLFPCALIIITIPKRIPTI